MCTHVPERASVSWEKKWIPGGSVSQEAVCCWNWSNVVLEHSLRCDCGVYRPVISCLYRSALFIECHYASSNCGITPIQTNKVKKKYRNISVNLNYMGQQYDIRVVQKLL